MKLIVPNPEIEDDSGFKANIDIFGRAEFGQNLLKIIQNTPDSLVIALDSAWGEGKSTFIKMWKGYLSQQEVPAIYFDAFANDYQKDPFLALTSQLYRLIDNEDEETRNRYKEKAISVIKLLGRSGFRIATRTLTAGLLDDIEFLKEINPEAAAGEVADVTDKIFEQYVSQAEEDEKCLEDFKIFLSELVKKLSNNGE